MKLILFLLLLIVFINENTAHTHEEKFSIYCSSNLDDTGTCSDENNQKFICNISTHKNLKCKTKVLKEYNCLQYGKILSKQSQFICNNDINSFNNHSNLPINNNKENNLIEIKTNKKNIKKMYEESFLENNSEDAKTNVDTSIF